MINQNHNCIIWGIWGGVPDVEVFDLFQMEVIVGDFGIVVVPRDGADTEKILNHSSILRKYKVNPRRRLDLTPNVY